MPETVQKKGLCTSGLFFFSAALLLLLFLLGHRSLWGSEGRWAEIAREMMLTSDYFHPTINWEPYFDKPLFTYWVIVLPAWISGVLNEFVARLPSAIAGLVTLYATISLGSMLFSKRAAYIAAWILLTSFGFIFWARTACADVENVAFILLAVLWYWKRRNRPVFSSFAVFYIICAVGAHFKGLPAAVLPGVICLPDLLRGGRWKNYISLSHAAAIFIGITLYLAPFLYAAYTAHNYSQSGLYMVFHENILRFFNAFDHKEPFYVYIFYVPLLFMPWAPLLVAALADFVSGYRDAEPGQKWLIETVAIIFVIYTISESRRSYYIMPIMPFCALVIGNALANMSAKKGWSKAALGFQFYLIATVSVAEALSPALVPVIKKFTGIVPPAGLATALSLTGLFSIVVLFYVSRRGPDCMLSFSDPVANRKFAAVLASTLVLTAGFYCVQQNILEQYRPYRPFIKEARAIMGDIAPDNVALGKNIASVVFYLGFDSAVKVVDSRELAREFLSQDGVRYLIAQRRQLEKSLSVLPERIKNKPLLSSELYPGQRRKKMQLLMWKFDGPVQ